MEEIKLLLTKLNKVELAKELGVTRMTIYNYLDGTHNPSYNAYKKILKLIETNGLQGGLKGGEEN